MMKKAVTVLKSIFTFWILTSNIIICMVDNGRYSKWNNALYMCEKNYLVCSYLIKVGKKTVCYMKKLDHKIESILAWLILTNTTEF